ncbi:CRISPR-associated exonuclease, Cas4 family [uncultured Sporomusa sp.]|uniref:CRISPR-associated exonuclease, Cas4 family n=1 Tax=uncultured Sporomusa sp. TaxID=307249 RepID=A0A212M0H1_9FIRM|nr:CRISPR-associated protein Cas4 [uncultured Sporomusa sp.]SCM83149.1 CRISPR-associated exonuclease, Cas4 family [uncultured Sporomusa sp.]
MMLTGTLVNYYIHCPRQCWLFYHKLNLEDNSEDVRIGRVLHALKAEKDGELAIDNIKLDKITDEYVVELKKSDADLPAAMAQVQFYLMRLAEKGISRKGRLEVWEKNKQDRKVHYTELNEALIEQLTRQYAEIEEFLQTPVPPAAKLTAKCKRCAYYEYCYI